MSTTNLKKPGRRTVVVAGALQACRGQGGGEGVRAAIPVPIYGYASVVRDGTGDAIFIFGTSPNN